MTGILREQLTGLAGSIAGLKERVQTAVAGELGRAISGVVQQLVQAVVSGRTEQSLPEPSPSARRFTPNRWDEDVEDDRWARPRDPWNDDLDELEHRHAASVRHDSTPPEPTENAPAVATAVTAGVYVARMWLVRRGTLLTAVGFGLGVGVLGIFGGPVVRTAVAILAATADVMAVSDSLGDGAARLEQL